MKTKKHSDAVRCFTPAEKILEEMHVPFIETDRDGLVLRANRTALAMYSEEMGDLIGMHIWELMTPEENDLTRRSFKRAMEADGDLLPVQRSLLTRDGCFRTFEVHRYLSRDEQGVPCGMCSVSFDITETVRSKEEEHAARVWAEMQLESLPDAILSVDALGLIRTANRAAEQLTGWVDGNLLGQIIEKVLDVQEYSSSQSESFTHSITQGSHTRGFARIINLHKEEISVEIRTFPMRDKFTGVINGALIILRRKDDF
jgi:PAS domain S-box-containing protein